MPIFLLMEHVKLLISLLALAGALSAQPSLRITSPADGTTVHPGDSLTVAVTASPTEDSFLGVFIGAPDPLGVPFSKVNRAQPPFRFTIEVPRDTRPTAYALTAGGVTASRQFVYSTPIEILVERADSPVSIDVYPVIADFTMDQKRYFSVTGRYADKTEADLSQSSRIKYVSEDPEIATVDAQGIVSPVAPGKTRITITYDNLRKVIPVIVRQDH